MIVMKFGGSSVKDAKRIINTAEIIKSRLSDDPVVVVSALGGITDMLIEASENAFSGKDSSSILKQIKERHVSTLKDLGLDETLVDKELKEFTELIQRIASVKEVTTETMDHVQSFGERMSAKLVAGHLNKIGIIAEAHNAYDVGFVSNDDYGNAEPIKETEEQLRQHLSNKKALPVITGFIAKNKAGKITTLGRGGSDYTAAIVGTALNVSEIQIWTDVNGIMTTDPRIVNTAKTISEISFNEASELAFFGAKVLHPKTIIPAIEKNIPVRVLNTYEPTNKGTVIVKEAKKQAVKGIACKRGNILMNITSQRMVNAHGFLARLFSVFKKYGKSVDMIATSEVSVSLTIDSDRYLDEITKELKKTAEVTIAKNKSIICVVGNGMQDSRGVIGRVLQTLSDLRIEMVSAGASEINISLIVDDKDADTALKKLHAEYFE
ncbi:MAG: lysine-sensitive aspartokinase 3 [Nanoarchaeota archaeon]